MADVLVLLIGPVVLVVVVVLYVVALRTRHHYTSLLTCPKCNRTFDYEWVPLASFSAVRLGKERYLQCPLCHESSMFNMRDARRSSPRT